MRRLVGYFGFRDWVNHWLSFISTIFPPKSKRMVLARQGVIKQYGNRPGLGAWALAMSVFYAWRKVGIFAFHDVCGMERQFNVFSVVVDILELASSP